jgi:hypothetical protein
MGLRNLLKEIQGNNAERQSRVAPRDSTKTAPMGQRQATDESEQNNRAKILELAVSEAG